MENIISFLEIKSFIIRKLQEFSIDEFYFRKHEYFIYDADLSVKLNAEKILDLLSEEFDCLKIQMRDFIYGIGNQVLDVEPLEKYREQYFSPKSIIDLIQKEGCLSLTDCGKKKIYEHFFQRWAVIHLRNITNYKSSKLSEFDKYISGFTNQLDLIQCEMDELYLLQKQINDILVITEQSNERILKIQHEISTLQSLNDKSYDYNIENLDKQLQQKLIHVENCIKDLDTKKRELKGSTDLERNFAEIKSLKDQKIQEKELFIKSSPELDYQVESKLSQLLTTSISGYGITNDFFFEIYPSHKNYDNYLLTENLQCKKLLLKILNQKIPKPLIFRIVAEKYFEKPKFATILSELKVQENQYNLKDVPANIDDLFPIWYSLKNALLNNEIINNEYNYSYISLNNGIFAKIVAYKSKPINEKIIIALKCEDKRQSHNPTDFTFYRDCDIFSGYASSGFSLIRGIYINYKEFSFEIDFFANALLLQNLNYFQQIQSISDKIKISDVDNNQYDDDDY